MRDLSLPPLVLTTWQWPLAQWQGNQNPMLSHSELQALLAVTQTTQRENLRIRMARAENNCHLARLLDPLQRALAAAEIASSIKSEVLWLLLRTCARQEQAFWAWSHPTWIRILGTSRQTFYDYHQPSNHEHLRQPLVALAYLLGCFRDVRLLGGMEMKKLAQKIFGTAHVSAALYPIVLESRGWGYSTTSERETAFCSVATEVLLLNGSPDWRDLTLEFLTDVHASYSHNPARRALLYRLSRVLAHLHLLPRALPLTGGIPAEIYQSQRERDIDPEWVEWVERWYHTSPRGATIRKDMRRDLLRVGRWLAQTHPTITSPAQWTRELAAEWIAVVNQMHTGDFSTAGNYGITPGQHLSATRKHGLLGVLRRSFLEMQEWGWIERRFNPLRVFATPRAIKHQIGPKPRVIADDLWAKLLWAGLNIEPSDIIPARLRRDTIDVNEPLAPFYPIELIRALAITWLFCGLRSDEIVRLRVGCIRVQEQYGDTSTATAACLLDIPVHKTGHAFTKPVDMVVADAIQAWEAVRPTQPRWCDPKTNERVHLLFFYRGKPLARAYINQSLIPMLCAKAGIPSSDARGSISSHRARSTIASQLFNAREPMSLFELQAWLGHRSPQSTQYYVAATATTLTKAYTEANYFSRNIRTIEVLLDRDVVMSGQAAEGTPWRYYDLGHGYCTYDFFDQCPHRMACAKCTFYMPKGETRVQLLEAKGHLTRMLQEIPLTDEERHAVEDGAGAVERLLAILVDQPTPAGPTPRELFNHNQEIIPLLPRVDT